MSGWAASYVQAAQGDGMLGRGQEGILAECSMESQLYVHSPWGTAEDT